MLIEKISITNPVIVREIAKQLDEQDKMLNVNNREIQVELERIADQIVSIKFLLELFKTSFTPLKNHQFIIEDMEDATKCIEAIFNIKFEEIEESKQRIENNRKF